MRHRAPSPLSRLLGTVHAHRGVAVGAVVLAGASAGVGLLSLAGSDPASDDRVTAGPFEGERASTAYPGAAALETVRASSAAVPSRGHARATPSPTLSSPVGPGRAPSLAGTPVPTRSSAPAAPDASRDSIAQSPVASRTPEPSGAASSPSGEAGSPGSPSAPSSSAPADPSVPAGPETTAVTQLAAAGTWTIVLGSDRLATFQCSLDGAPFSGCAPVATYAGLTPGQHTLSARAVDSAGAADSTPAVLSTHVAGPLP